MLDTTALADARHMEGGPHKAFYPLSYNHNRTPIKNSTWFTIISVGGL
jgi:hypothetical protein